MKLTQHQLNRARTLAVKSEQDVIICINHGITKTITTSNYIKRYLAIYDIQATITPTGQVILSKHYN